jgi:hypothetical protein
MEVWQEGVALLQVDYLRIIYQHLLHLQSLQLPQENSFKAEMHNKQLEIHRVVEGGVDIGEEVQALEIQQDGKVVQVEVDLPM